MPKLVQMGITVYLTQLPAIPAQSVTIAKTEISLTVLLANSAQAGLHHSNHALLEPFAHHRI